jgi:thiamine monophosphate synthase
MKLIAGDVETVPAGRSAFRMKNLFQSCMSDLAASIEPICRNFSRELNLKVDQNLADSLQAGALRGGQEAMSTVHSWGSKNRRTKHERAPDKNGELK